MEKITGDEPAMPIFFEGNLGQMNSTGGLTIRQQFAMAAMVGCISRAPNGHLGNTKEGSQLAVEWADALIAELNKPTDL